MHRIKHHIKKHHKKYLFSIFGGRAIFKTVLLIVGLFGVVNVELDNNKTYAANAEVIRDGGGTTDNRSEEANWAGDTLPDSTDVAIFDGTSSDNAIINTNINVRGIEIRTGYVGTITQNTGINITLGNSGYNQFDGIFNGGSGNMFVGQTLNLNSGIFNAPSGVLKFTGGYPYCYVFVYNGGDFYHNSGTIEFAGGWSQCLEINKSLSLDDLNFNLAYGFYITNNLNNLVVNGSLNLINGSFSDWSQADGIIIAKKDVLIKSGFNGGYLKIKTSGDVNILSESGSKAPYIELNDGGIMTAGNNSIIRSLIINDGGIFNSTSGNLTIIQDFIYNTGALFYNNSGKLLFKTDNQFSCTLNIKQNLNLYKLEKDGIHNIYITNNGNDLIVNDTLTLINGSFADWSQPNGVIITKKDILIKSTFLGGHATLKTSGDVIVVSESGSKSPYIELNNGGIMNAGSDSTINQLTINNGGIFNAPFGNLNLGPLNFNTGGLFNHNNGYVKFTYIYPIGSNINQFKELNLYKAGFDSQGVLIYNNGYNLNVSDLLSVVNGIGNSSNYFSMINSLGDVLIGSGVNSNYFNVNLNTGSNVIIETGAVTPILFGLGKVNSFNIYSGATAYFGSNMDIGTLNLYGTTNLNSNNTTDRYLTVSNYNSGDNVNLNHVIINRVPSGLLKSYIVGYEEESDRLDVSLKQYRFTNLRKTLPLTLNEAYNAIFNIKNNLGRATSGDRLITPFGFRAPVPDSIASGDNVTVELKVKFFNLDN